MSFESVHFSFDIFETRHLLSSAMSTFSEKQRYIRNHRNVTMSLVVGRLQLWEKVTTMLVLENAKSAVMYLTQQRLFAVFGR